MNQLTALESLGIAKAIAAQFLADDTFSVAAFVRDNSGLILRGEYRPEPEYLQARVAANIQAHYVAAVTGDGGRADLVAWVKAHKRGIMELRYR